MCSESCKYVAGCREVHVEGKGSVRPAAALTHFIYIETKNLESCKYVAGRREVHVEGKGSVRPAAAILSQGQR